MLEEYCYELNCVPSKFTRCSSKSRGMVLGDRGLWGVTRFRRAREGEALEEISPLKRDTNELAHHLSAV